ncbi:type II secretion system F family protein [Ilumatobacter sp.]|uniref:type II secretion system F family protein n=1 Tax=Ilumatobacter sp. TaxID=1967498 RepID=UPI003B51E503
MIEALLVTAAVAIAVLHVTRDRAAARRLAGRSPSGSVDAPHERATAGGPGVSAAGRDGGVHREVAPAAPPILEAVVRRRRARRDRGLTPTAVATWVDELARHLRHGASLRDTVATIVPAHPAVRAASAPLRHAVARGSTVVEACDRWMEELAASRAPRLDLLSTTAIVLGSVAAVGGSSTAPLERVAAAMRQHASDDLERSAQSAQARLSARVLTVVPVGVLAILVAADHDVRRVLTSATGFGVVALGLALDATGAWWMRRIVRRHGGAGAAT